MNTKGKVKTDFQRQEKRITIGTLGHVDSGKSTTTSAITKVLADIGLAEFRSYNQIDNAKEESCRGLTISLSHLYYRTKKYGVSHIDAPGHRDFIKNMITGAAQMDGAILVVDAIAGVMAQTTEHVTLAAKIGIKHFVVWLNKVDMMSDRDMLDMIQEEVKDLLAAHGYTNVPIVEGSAMCAINGTNDEIGRDAILKLMDTVDEYIPEPERKCDAPFKMIIDSVKSSAQGPVVTGAVQQGRLNVGEPVEIIGGKRFYKDPIVVKSMQMFNQNLNNVQAGDTAALCLRNVERSKLRKGQVAILPGSMKAYKKFLCTVVLLTHEEGRTTPIFSGFTPQFYFGTANASGIITLPEGTSMMKPGDTCAEVQVEFVYDQPIEVGDRMTIREHNTIGHAVITSIVTDSK